MESEPGIFALLASENQLPQVPPDVWNHLAGQSNTTSAEVLPTPPPIADFPPLAEPQFTARPVSPPAVADSQPWWTEGVAIPIRGRAVPLPIDLDQLFLQTVQHSHRVLATAQKVNVQLMRIEQAEGAFDPTLYSDNRFDSTSDPVQNTLTTGGPPRLEDAIVGLDAGLRGQSRGGTQYNLGQRLGHKNSNSLFFTPNDQGSSRLYANMTKPLLRGRKIDVNRSLVLTARFESEAARAEYEEILQAQLFQVANAYWNLYIERSSLLQRQRHLARAMEIADLLRHREGHDVLQSQILRASSAIAIREAEIAQADTRIRNLEAQLRALTNAPELTDNRQAEFLPIQPAQIQPIELDLETECHEALKRRPELASIENKIQAVQVQLRLAEDQKKPTLNLVAEGYLAGLRGESDIPGAWVDQFSTGSPGYAAGLIYERPLRNRAAEATVRQLRFELSQLIHLANEADENVRAEVETAIRNVDAAKQLAQSRQRSLDAIVAEVDFLYDRWKSLGNDPKLGQLQLDELLRAQDRLLQEEQSLLQALVQYNQTLLEVQRSTGALIQFAE